MFTEMTFCKRLQQVFCLCENVKHETFVIKNIIPTIKMNLKETPTLSG